MYATNSIRISVVRHKFSIGLQLLVGCWLDRASELSARDAVRQRPPAEASARSSAPFYWLTIRAVGCFVGIFWVGFPFFPFGFPTFVPFQFVIELFFTVSCPAGPFSAEILQNMF